MDASQAAVYRHFVVLVADAAILYALSRLLPLRRPRLLYAGELCCFFALIFLVPTDATGWKSLVSAIAFFALPVACYEGSFFTRALGAGVGALLSVAGELAGVLVWMLLTGLAVMDFEALALHPVAFAVAVLLEAAFIAASGRALASPLRAFARMEGTFAHGFAQLVALQGLVLFSLVYFLLDSFAGAPWAWASAIVLVGVLTVGDVYLYKASRRASAEEAERRRAEALGAELELCLSSYEELVADATASARLRHDARNHLQVLRALMDKGDEKAALSYARELAGHHE